MTGLPANSLSKGDGGERRWIQLRSIFEGRYRCKWNPKNEARRARLDLETSVVSFRAVAYLFSD